MASYPVRNTETGEQKEVVMSVHDWDQWKIDNPEWIRDFSDPRTCPMATEVGHWSDKIMRTHPGWNDVLHTASKQPGATVKPFS